MYAPGKEEMIGLSKSALRSVRFVEGVKEHIDKKHLWMWSVWSQKRLNSSIIKGSHGN